MEKIRISKTLLLSWEDYIAGKECGIYFREVILYKRYKSKKTPAMHKGQRFEYLAIGTKPGGEIPGEILTDSGNVSKTEEARVRIHAQKFKDTLEHYGITMEQTDKKMEIEFENYTMVFILDYLGFWKNGRRLVGDLKYSGLLYNKWEETGWDANKLPYRPHLMTQPILYMYALNLMEGTIPDFLFHVHSSSNDIEFELYEINLNNPGDTFTYLEDRIESCIDGIARSEDYGYTPRPGVKKCLDCPVLECKFRMKIPEINGVFIG